MGIEQTARDFSEASDAGDGRAACKGYRQDGASFACLADALAGTTTLAGCAAWMKGLPGPIPDRRYALMAFAADPLRGSVVAAAVFHGTQTGEGGPVAPAGSTVASGCVHQMALGGGRLGRMTKIRNDAQALRQLGWA